MRDARRMGTSRPSPLTLFPLLRFAEVQPVAMLPPGMMRVLPARIDNRALANLDDAVARRKADSHGRLEQFNVRPLEAVPMNVIGDFAKQHAFRLEHAIGFGDKRRIQVRKVISVARRRFLPEAEARIEV